MTSNLVAALLCGGLLATSRSASALETVVQVAQPAGAASGPQPAGGIIIPSLTNAVRLRLYTNASPDSARLFNSFDLEAFGEVLLQSPDPVAMRRWVAGTATNVSPHNVLVNGSGPQLAASNGMSVLERMTGPGWSYVALDVSRAYADALKEYRRGILFVEPDLFILWDHLVARQPMTFQMRLHPPAGTGVDPIWRDLRLELPRAGVRIHAPAPRKQTRDWRPVATGGSAFPAGTTSWWVGPTNRLAAIDLLTVFAVHRAGEKKELAFRLIEGKEAVGARIHRNGYPTLVAFKTDAAARGASLTGFEFQGPVGVSVFTPTPKTP